MKNSNTRNCSGRIERMIASKMPPGYNFLPEPNAVAAAVLSKSTWAVLGATLMIELFTQTHYLKSIQPDSQLSPLFKDVFLVPLEGGVPTRKNRRAGMGTRERGACPPRSEIRPWTT